MRIMNEKYVNAFINMQNDLNFTWSVSIESMSMNDMKYKGELLIDGCDPYLFEDSDIDSLCELAIQVLNEKSLERRFNKAINDIDSIISDYEVTINYSFNLIEGHKAKILFGTHGCDMKKGDKRQLIIAVCEYLKEHVDVFKERKKNTFESELTELINRYSLDARYNTHDYILSNYLSNCLCNYGETVTREKSTKG